MFGTAQYIRVKFDKGDFTYISQNNWQKAMKNLHENPNAFGAYLERSLLNTPKNISDKRYW
jgi:hypothetical protein